MSSHTAHPLWPGLAGALSGIWRLVGRLIGAALLIGLALLGLAVAAGLMLRALWVANRTQRRSSVGPGAAWRGAIRPGAHTPVRRPVGEVVDVEVREVAEPHR